MSQEEKNEKSSIKNRVLFENEEYNKSIALKDQVIAGKDQTIEILTKQIGEKDQIITSQATEIEKEKIGRVSAENQIAESKELKVEHKGNYFKTEEEKFVDSFSKE